MPKGLFRDLVPWETLGLLPLFCIGKKYLLVQIRYICIHGTVSEFSAHKVICILKWSWFCLNSTHFTYFLVVKSKNLLQIREKGAEYSPSISYLQCGEKLEVHLQPLHFLSERKGSLRHHLCLWAPQQWVRHQIPSPSAIFLISFSFAPIYLGASQCAWFGHTEHGVQQQTANRWPCALSPCTLLAFVLRGYLGNCLFLWGAESPQKTCGRSSLVTSGWTLVFWRCELTAPAVSHCFLSAPQAVLICATLCSGQEGWYAFLLCLLV